MPLRQLQLRLDREPTVDDHSENWKRRTGNGEAGSEFLMKKHGWIAVLSLIIPLGLQAKVVRIPDELPTIQAAVDVAGPGDTLLVAAGSYTENVVIRGKENLTLVGEEGAEKTVIDGDEKGSVITVEDCAGTITVRGLTAQRGYNTANGGGMLCRKTEMLVLDCAFLDNTANNEGGGLSLLNCPGYLVESCLFERNESAAAAAIGIVGGRGALTGNTIRNNTGGLTLSVMYAGCDIRENLITRNLATGFGFIGYQMALSASIEGNTIAYNLGKEGSGAITAQFGDLRISRNLISYNDGVYGLFLQTPDKLVRPAGNNVWGNEAGGYIWLDERDESFEGGTGEGDLAADPLFCDPKGDDFRLRSGSPCLAVDGRSAAIGCRDAGCD